MFESLRYAIRGRKIANSLDEQVYHDADWLAERGIIKLTAIGRSITELSLDVVNRSDRRLKVLLPPGLTFLARGTHQNMVVTKEAVFRLKPRGSKVLPVQVACLNAHKPIPTSNDGFGSVERAGDTVNRFLAAAKGERAMVIQAGVWAITDHLDHNELKARLHNIANSHFAGQAISDNDIRTAGLLLSKAGIPTAIS